MLNKVFCPDCGSTMIIAEAQYGKYLRCIRWPDCSGSHSVNQNTLKPLGFPASKGLRRLRTKLHSYMVNLLDTDKTLTRRDVYTILRDEMKLPPQEVHVAKFSESQCHVAIDVIEKLLEEY